jgi:hypothetical protein
MPVFVCYEAPVAYQQTPVTLAGIFRDQTHFDDWQTRERQRACYSGQPFLVRTLRQITEQEYQEVRICLQNPISSTRPGDVSTL